MDVEEEDMSVVWVTHLLNDLIQLKPSGKGGCTLV